MKSKYKIGIFGDGVDELLKGVQEYKKWIQRKTDELARRLAIYGYDISFNILADHIFSGESVGSLKVTRKGDGQYLVSAQSEAILFIEFGAGLQGGGHENPVALTGEKFGPGTYPGKGHWNDPNGWWYETDDPKLIVKRSKKTGKGYGHSYGNKPHAPMYTAVKTLNQELEQIVQEVFSHE